jgi:hypothetical protein
MNVIRKDASITNVDEDGPGAFQVVLSAPTKDRDGDTLLSDEWKQPLPEHITFDIDHEMSVKGTVGSGRPWIDHDNTLGQGKGALIVDGTYSSLPHAQDVRTLVKEGHINRTSVAFMSEKTQKDGKSAVTRELLNGAFVAVPSNREASHPVLEGAEVRPAELAADLTHLNAIVEHAGALGADLTGGDDDVRRGCQAAAKMFRDLSLKTAVGDVFTRFDRGDIDADQALTLIRDAGKATDEEDVPTDGGQIEDADSGATSTSAADAAKAAPAAEVKEAPVEDALIDQQVKAARMRFYATLSERN